jgi:hypothetical protein
VAGQSDRRCRVGRVILRCAARDHPLVKTHQRAGLFAAVCLVAYPSFGVPAIKAGLLIAPAGLLATVLGYDAAIILAASAGLAVQIRNTRNQARNAAEGPQQGKDLDA